MAQREFTRKQGIGLICGVILTLVLLIWGGKQLLRPAEQSVAPQEVPRIVEEEVAPGTRTAQPSAAAVPMTDEQARRQERLENLKFGVQHGN